MHDDWQLFEFLSLEGAYGPRLLGNPGIVRNRLKIAAAIQNAKAFLVVQHEFGSFDQYPWSFVGGESIQNGWKSMSQIPARTAESDALSRDLRRQVARLKGPARGSM